MSGPLPAYLGPITVPASFFYGMAVAARNARFDRGVNVESIDRPVISVGNLTTGGTGKTPMVAWIAQQLMDAHRHPVIAMRGYRAQAGAGGVSDEQAEYAQRLPGVHVLANPGRIAALRAFLPRHPDTDCVILDDGFQHRQLKRDLDLVLIDAGSDVFRDRLLPAGNLREPVGNLGRADAIVVTHADECLADARSQVSDLKSEISHLKSQIERHHGKPPIALARHVWTHLDVHATTPVGGVASTIEPTDWLRGKRVLTMLGIGRPQSVHGQLEALGATIAVDIPCRDHERYDRAKLAVARGLCDPGSCDAMVTTAKDWVKLAKLLDSSSFREGDGWPVPIVVPQLAIEFIEGEQALRDLIMGV